VAHAMVYRETVAADAPVTERVLPDGALRLVIDLGERPAAFVVGPSIRPAVLTLSGRMHGLSLTLRPGAAMALFGVPASELAEQAPALSDLWRHGMHELVDELAEAAATAPRVRAVWRHLARRAAPPPGSAPERVAATARLITAAGGALALPELTRLTGLGERRLQQLFSSQLGLSPRAFGRLARLQAMVRTLRAAAEPDWAQLAADGGFSDQSHLIHEFRELFGLTPTAYRRLAISGSSKTAERVMASIEAPRHSRNPR
jgi:AraC-like DNA-binding protein